MFNLFIPVPSKAPMNLTVTAASSTSINASWQLPPADSRHENIKGFKLFFKKKYPLGSPTSVLSIHDGAILTKTVHDLTKSTEYEVQVLAFTSVGDGPKSPVKEEKTNEGGKGLD